MITSIIIVFVKVTIVGNVVPEYFVNSALETDWLNEQISSSQISVTFYNFFNSPFIKIFLLFLNIYKLK